MYRTEGDWDKKLSFSSTTDLYRNDHNSWDTIDGNPIKVEIYYLFKEGENRQHNMTVWVDDNNVGYFYSDVCFTESGTIVGYDGDKVGISFTFQKEEDAIAFKLKWL